jgi:hypothetical protein
VIPAGISSDHVLAALSRIDREGIPPSRANRSVELRHSDKRYPPKLVMSYACEFATGRELRSGEFITPEAERYLTRLGFSVVRTGQHSYQRDKEQVRSVPPPVLSDLPRKELEELGQQLAYSSRLYRWSELKNNSTLPPRSPGVYAWFFKRVPPGVPTDLCVVRDEATLLYVGISPRNDRTKGTLQDRLWSHFEGIAEFSTLRTTLGSLLEGELGTVLRRVGSGKTQTFVDKESALSRWMADNARITWIETPKPWVLEDHLLKRLSLPLNIEGNANHPFSPRLIELRRRAVRRAEGLPIVPRRKTLFLVSCVSEKHPRPMPARELYCSIWFQKARAFVEKQTGEWLILSARYGLVEPDKVIEPYNETLNEQTIEERREWSKKVVQELRPHCPAGTSVVFLAGEKYRDFLAPALSELGCRVEIPMEGLAIGEQLRWLSEHG